MPTPTYTPLATVTLGSSASSVTFSSIPATYRDLVLVINGQTLLVDNIAWQANGDTGSNYSRIQALADASGITSNAPSGTFGFAGTSYAQQSTNITQFMDYSATDKHKTSLGRVASPTGEVAMTASRYANTAAITSLRIFPTGSSFAAATTLSLYGIAS